MGLDQVAVLAGDPVALDDFGGATGHIGDLVQLPRRRTHPDHGAQAISKRDRIKLSAIAANPGFPSPSYSADGSFIYNNVYYPNGMAFDVDGLLFATAENLGGYWNLWGNSPGDYSLFESNRAGE